MDLRKMGTPLLEVRDASYTYPDGTQALKRVNVEIYEGTIVAIIGANGSGKSTLLMLLAGLLQPQEGYVKFKGQDMEKLGYEVRREIGIVFQDPDDQLFASTVYDDIAFGLRLMGLSEEEVKLRVHEITNELGIAHLLSKPPYRLSGGEKRKVALATALILKPSVLLLDEPFVDLTQHAVNYLMSLILNFKRSNRTVVFTSHDVDIVAELADYVYVLADGHVIAHGEPKTILCNKEILSKAELKEPIATIIYREVMGLHHDPPIRISELISALKKLKSRAEITRRAIND